MNMNMKLMLPSWSFATNIMQYNPHFRKDAKMWNNIPENHWQHFYFFMKKFCFHRNAKVTDNGTHANVTFMDLGASGNDLATCDSHEPPIFSLKGP